MYMLYIVLYGSAKLSNVQIIQIFAIEMRTDHSQSLLIRYEKTS